MESRWGLKKPNLPMGNCHIWAKVWPQKNAEKAKEKNAELLLVRYANPDNELSGLP